MEQRREAAAAAAQRDGVRDGTESEGSSKIAALEQEMKDAAESMEFERCDSLASRSHILAC